MARAKALNTYPATLWELVQKCAVDGQSFSQPIPNVRAGLSLQGQFYAFRVALRREIEHTPDTPANAEILAKYRATLEMAEKTVCWVDKTHNTVNFCARDQTPLAHTLAGMLERPIDLPQARDAEIEKSQAELLKKLSGKGEKE